MPIATTTNGAPKRPLPDDNPDNASSSSDDETGPALPSATADASASLASRARKKRRTLPHEKLYVAALPLGTARYSKSLMHKDQLAFARITPHTDFLITAGVDGQVSFWKKSADGDVDFVKEFKAHAPLEDGSEDGQPVLADVSVSWDGRSFASVGGADGTIKVWDVETFDLVTVLQPEFSTLSVHSNDESKKRASCICWVHGRGRGLPMLAVGNNIDGEVLVMDGRGEPKNPLFRVKSGRLHRKPVIAMAYNHEWDCIVSADESGMVEYWMAEESLGKPGGVWEMKGATSLFEFRKAKSVPTSITFSPTGKQFATFSMPDRQVRVFDFASGKLYRTYDESIHTLMDMQQAGTAAVQLDQVEFGRRIAVERELDHPAIRRRINVIFDETGHFIMYGSLHGIKVLNTLTNRVLRVYGRDEAFRVLNVALYQGQPQKKGVVTVQMAASDNPLLQEAEARDAMLVATAAGKVRFYIYTNETEVDRSNRDVQNEKPRNLGASSGKQAPEKTAETGSQAVMHTTHGDITLRLFPAIAPKAVENWVTHARRGYYNGIIFHRVIRKFMIQTGDPLGDGTGGDSIWGAAFTDEFSPSIKHDKPYCLSMANAGPNTNGSQFFITTERAPWLDGKHTIFGRAVGGLDVVHRIENARVYKERPEEDIRIVSIDVS